MLRISIIPRFLHPSNKNLLVNGQAYRVNVEFVVTIFQTVQRARIVRIAKRINTGQINRQPIEQKFRQTNATADGWMDGAAIFDSVAFKKFRMQS